MSDLTQFIGVTSLRIGPQVAQAGYHVEWRLASEAIGKVTVPVMITYESEPPLREGEVVASLLYPKKEGGMAELEVRGPARVGILKLDFVPEAYGDVWLALHYGDQLYFEEKFSIEELT